MINNSFTLDTFDWTELSVVFNIFEEKRAGERRQGRKEEKKTTKDGSSVRKTIECNVSIKWIFRLYYYLVVSVFKQRSVSHVDSISISHYYTCRFVSAFFTSTTTLSVAHGGARSWRVHKLIWTFFFSQYVFHSNSEFIHLSPLFMLRWSQLRSQNRFTNEKTHSLMAL